MENNKTKEYGPFSSPFKNEQNIWVGTNFMGVPKNLFTFKMKVYYDLPIQIGDKTVTYREFNFMKMPNTTKIYGIPMNKIKQNAQMKDCVNFFINDKQKLPVLDLDSKSTIFKEGLLNNIKTGMIKTKEFYSKHPPLPQQELKVFETTITENQDGSFKVNNLTNKYFNGNIELNGKKYANVYFPFDGQDKTFLVPVEDFIDNKDGSFSIEIKNAEYKIFPTKSLIEISRMDFQNMFKTNIEKSIQTEKTL